MSSIIGSILSSINGQAITSFTNEATGAPCWTGAQIKDVEFVTESANSENPLSTEQVNETSVYTGLLAADIKTAKILLPVKMRVMITTDNISLIESIISVFADPTVTLSVTSKSIVSPGMALTHLSIEQMPEMLSASRLSLMLEQIQEPMTSSYNPSQAGDQSSLGLGVQTLNSVGPSLSTTVGNNVGSLVSTATTAVGSLYQRVIANLGL